MSPILPPKTKCQRNSDSTPRPSMAPSLPNRSTNKCLQTVPSTQQSVALSSGSTATSPLQSPDERGNKLTYTPVMLSTFADGVVAAIKEEINPKLMSPFLGHHSEDADMSASSALTHESHYIYLKLQDPGFDSALTFTERRLTRSSTVKGKANALSVLVRIHYNATPGPSGTRATPDGDAEEEPMASLKRPESLVKTPFIAPRLCGRTSSSNDTDVSMPTPVQPPVGNMGISGSSYNALPATPVNIRATRMDSPDHPMAPPPSPKNLPVFEVKINLDFLRHSIARTDRVNLTEIEIEHISSLWGAEKQAALMRLSLQDLIELKLWKIITDVAISTTLFERFAMHLANFHLTRNDTIAMMKFAECLFSGSIVLAIMFPGRFVPGDIDIYISKTYQHAVMHFLWKHGYSGGKSIYVDHLGKDNYLGSAEGVHAIFELTHPDSNKKINVIVSVSKPILPILLFHSTLLMNYIAYHGVVLLNGRMTIQGVGVSNYLPEKITDHVKQCFDKYAVRGFKIWHWNKYVHTCGSSAGCPQTLRCLFNDHVGHFLFPGQHSGMNTTYRLNKGSLVKWRSSSGPACMSSTDNKHSFIACDDFYHSTVKDKSLKGLIPK